MHSLFMRKFQSSPSREAGRYGKHSARRAFDLLFQSSPSREAGRYDALRFVLPDAFVFQSSPSREAGRYIHQGFAPHLQESFNPRPAVRPGATDSKLAIMPAMVVSILAQP